MAETAEVMDREDRMGQVVEALGDVGKHCPFRKPDGTPVCEAEDYDEYGYCPHLVGFTNNKTDYEPITKVLAQDAEGKDFDTGLRKVVGGRRGKEKKKCLKGDQFINPTTEQIIKGIRYMAKKWVSDRVYRLEEAKKA